VFLAVYTPSLSQSVRLGERVSLACGLWRGQQSRFAVEWRHRALGDGSMLFAYDGWRDHVEETAPDCHMNFSSLHSRGDASLSLERATVSHDGTFLCTVYLPYVRAQRDIHLRVTAVPQVSLLPDPLFALPGEELSLSCEVSKFHPLDVSVEFLIRLAGESHWSALPGALLSRHTVNQDGTFSVTSSLRVPASGAHHGAQYSCRVRHASASGVISRTHTLHIAG
ncbi:hypothetical protein FKM82_029279, partial [Ascaphus truei]